MNSFIGSKKAGIIVASVALLATTVFASAQVISSPTQVQSSLPCTQITHTLYYGSRDFSTNGDVTSLQNFLSADGYLQVPATGFFGSYTLRATQQFQSSQGIAAIGLVGPLTRAAIARVSCAGGNPPPTSNITIYSMTPSSGPTGTTVTIDGFGFSNDNTIHFGYGVVVHVPISSSRAIACTTDPSCRGGIHQTLVFNVPASLDPACRFTFPICAIASRQTLPGDYPVSVENSNGTSNAMTFTVTGGTTSSGPNISSISPSSGTVGTTVSLFGSGFNKNDVVIIGGGAINNLSIGSDGTSLTFVVPSGVGAYCPPGSMCPMYLRLLSPGNYDISVKDESSGATSNSVNFNLTGASNQNISISGLDAPSTLALGQSGTWTVHATLSSNTSGNLHYAVVWGDENASGNAMIMAPQPTSVQTSATFTHAYQHSGSYTPTFTVTDDSGHSATVSASVQVTPLY